MFQDKEENLISEVSAHSSDENLKVARVKVERYNSKVSSNSNKNFIPIQRKLTKVENKKPGVLDLDQTQRDQEPGTPAQIKRTQTIEDIENDVTPVHWDLRGSLREEDSMEGFSLTAMSLLNALEEENSPLAYSLEEKFFRRK